MAITRAFTLFIIYDYYGKKKKKKKKNNNINIPMERAFDRITNVSNNRKVNIAEKTKCPTYTINIILMIRG